MKRAPARPRSFVVGIAVLAVAFATIACGSAAPGTPAATDSAPQEATSSTPQSAAVRFAFPTGPAVTVPVGYTPPSDRVDSTGAHLPANGKPTLVFVDAIW
ncbi:MAG: hypothetical protein O3B31_14075 [Chloroflexi bacterium]|nr:hypothetical protein [Chloroflexota bacterium]